MGVPLAPAGGRGDRRRAASRDEIVPVGELDADESPRRDTSLEKLAALKPVFDPEGTTTAGNAPGVNDGAVLRRRRERGVGAAARDRAARDDPLAGVRRRTSSPTSRARPAKAAAIALERAGKTIDDVERVEINEAFASVAKHSTMLLGADEEQRERERRRGRARPSDRRLAAAGSSATLVHELRRNGGGLGLAAICSGGGQGDALLIEV